MIYRRFGRTELALPVFSCGGMRYQQAWQDLEPEAIDATGQANLEATIQRALELGINHIETARGYGSSETQLGLVLPHLPREEIIVQTKVGPAPDVDDFRRAVDQSLRRLRLDYVDLFALHGINNAEVLRWALRPGGCLEAAHRLREEGLCRHIGFSTHAPLDVILQAIRSGGFEYINLHFYWADQYNAPALHAAREQDLGIFIISPNDKGGRLYDPPQKLVELCRPLTPMAFNDLWTLTGTGVHTLSVGAARPTDFDAHLEALAWLDRPHEVLPEICARLHAEAERVLGADWWSQWFIGLPPIGQVPGEINLYHTLRLYNLAKAFDMVEYARGRYNLFGNGGHWFAGNKVDRADFEALQAVLTASPVADRIPAVLREAHDLLAGENVKRLSQS